MIAPNFWQARDVMAAHFQPQMLPKPIVQSYWPGKNYGIRAPEQDETRLSESEVRFAVRDGVVENVSMARMNSGVRSHQPKGGMCTSCAWARRNCEGLYFEAMPVIGKDDSTGAKIVRCTEYLSGNPEKKTDFREVGYRNKTEAGAMPVTAKEK